LYGEEKLNIDHLQKLQGMCLPILWGNDMVCSDSSGGFHWCHMWAEGQFFWA